MRTLLIPAALALLCACNASSYGAADVAAPGSVTAADDTGQAGDEDGAPDSADTGYDPPELYGIGGSLEIAKGAVVGGTIALAFEDDSREEALSCQEERAIAAVTEMDGTPDEVVWLWVQLSLEAPKSPCPRSSEVLAGEEGLYLGLGELHADLLPALAAQGYDTDTAGEHLYGVYAAVPGDASCAGDSAGKGACVYGYGGTAANRAGKEDAADGAPLPDGSYTLSYVYLFDIGA